MGVPVLARMNFIAMLADEGKHCSFFLCDEENEVL
jgi:hypothetical protein